MGAHTVVPATTAAAANTTPFSFSLETHGSPLVLAAAAAAA
eukprot:CAMPEP_0171614114 /NCGR_PEP_ID=MMETSP0990-20121206/12141_1 /TAXON_ID=483369 /ORGANISM="non described non described, Strain CCMP2098" /LENGTH=40 /DNA_ID= /DNA_START= /DNA_END= /DNA_ORIENTATION=